ncbi:glutathione S-transferase N-terminal domain-containing protein [Aureimonas jatrophae]|uniref:Glutathione S-transferase n=1 Tax=Aureimonas jatrophae TaxID=1166073 RepID=A0A1H0GB18_9HYPH|nr:glutathione S-transferase N-terminal domain-containing protein [Aureimonas jatrophae]SDO04066.1 glutathione S-transferase [Aureimonas jatrophae]
MRLLGTRPSPFTSKVRMAAVICGFELDLVPTDTAEEGATLVGTNPIGKIPALVLDDGSSLYDSRVICEWLDRSSGNLLIPQILAEWSQAKRIEALADGMTEAAMLTLYEVRYRPEDKRHQPWVDKQWRRAHRSLDALEHEVRSLGETPNLAHIAVASDLGWLDLRFSNELRDRHASLARWMDHFFAAHPELAAHRPAA